jgi:hypothetical protein
VKERKPAFRVAVMVVVLVSGAEKLRKKKIGKGRKKVGNRMLAWLK